MHSTVTMDSTCYNDLHVQNSSRWRVTACYPVYCITEQMTLKQDFKITLRKPTVHLFAPITHLLDAHRTPPPHPHTHNASTMLLDVQICSSALDHHMGTTNGILGATCAIHSKG